MCSDGSAIPEHGEQRSKNTRPGILAASSPNINLSTNMASEAISEHLILKIFLGEHAPRPPYCARAYAPSLVPPPTVGTFRRLCDKTHLATDISGTESLGSRLYSHRQDRFSLTGQTLSHAERVWSNSHQALVLHT